MATSTEPEENISYRTMDDLPGSYGWPIIGQSLKFVTDPIAMLAADVAVAVKEGMKITKSNLFGRKMIMVSDPELVDFLLKKENKLLKSHWFEHHVPLFGEESIFVVTHERHTLFRRLFDKAFQPNAMDLCFPTIVSSMQSYLSDWSVNGVTDMLGETKRMTFGLAMDLLVGRGRFNVEEMQELRCCFDTFLQGFASFIPYRLPGTQYKRSLDAKETLMKKLREVVTLVMEEDEIGITNDEIGRGSLTKILVSEFNNDVGETMNVEQISQNLVMLLFAGGDTSSAVMVLLLIILQNRPDVLAKLVEEQRDFVEMHGEAYTREQVLKDMLYTGAVLHETLRVLPIVDASLRVALQDFVLPGTDIKVREGDGIRLNYTMSQYDCNLDEFNADLPAKISNEIFNPDRLYELLKNGKKENKPFFGFGGGPRVCLGKPLAELETRVFLIELVRNYDFQLPKDRLYPELGKVIFPTPVKPLPVIFTRKAAAAKRN